MRRDTALFAGALVLFAGISAALGLWLAQRVRLPAEQPPPPGVVQIGIGEPLPPLGLPDLETGLVRQLAGPGRPRLINYWASWCGPCRKEMPVLNAYALEQGGNGVQVIGIALESADEAQAFLREVPVSFNLLVEAPGPADSSVRLGNRRGILPYTVLIDDQGRVAGTHYGPFPDLQAVRNWVRNPD